MKPLFIYKVTYRITPICAKRKAHYFTDEQVENMLENMRQLKKLGLQPLMSLELIED